MTGETANVSDPIENLWIGVIRKVDIDIMKKAKAKSDGKSIENGIYAQGAAIHYVFMRSWKRRK